MTEQTVGITLRGVTKHYGTVAALDDVSMTIDPDEFRGVIGPNGSGKTTLFRLIADLTRPTTGTIERPAAGIGYSFQEPRFFPDLTVRENLSVFRSLADDPPPTSWLDTLIDELRLDPAVHRRAGDVSGGFRKKLDLALAFVKRPQFLLLDEPLADVDKPSQRGILAFLQEYQAAGRTVVVSTHEVDTFEDLLGHVTILVDGAIQEDGPAADVLPGYREQFPSVTES